MAATLMTLIQASFVQQERVAACVKKPQKSSFENAKESPCAALAPVESLLVKQKDSAAPKVLANNVAGNLQQLIAVVAKLSDLDTTLAHAQQMRPAEDGEALKWHQLSLTTMEWSRKAQAEDVQLLLKELQSTILAEKLAVTEAKKGSTSGGACAQPACMPRSEFYGASVSDESSAGETEVKVESDGSVAEIEGKENVPIGSLRSDLEKIRDRDPNCCLIVRNIKRMGLESPELLREHFGRIGEVDEICVAHSFEKPNAKRTKHRNGRIRPAALGFVVMATVKDAQRVLAAGQDQMIGQVCVNVRLIEPFADKSSQPEGSP